MRVFHLVLFALALTGLLHAVEAPRAQAADTQDSEVERETDPVSDGASDSATPRSAPLIASRIFTRNLGDGQRNTVLSPLSLEIALALMGEGANGSVEQLIEGALGRSLEEVAGFDEALTSDKAKVLTANALWLPRGTRVMAAFRDSVETKYAGEVRALDFTDPQSVREINDWTSQKTERLIPQVIDRLSPQTSLVATNALYFKSAWLFPFDGEKTQDEHFTTADSRQVEVPMMSATGRYAYAETALNQVIALPYADAAYSMLLILPKAGGDAADARDEAVALGFKQMPLDDLAPKSVALRLPRFTADAQTDLTLLLAAEGLSGLFGNVEAFSKIARPAPVITSVLQGCLVKVDEAGTEAAAATAVVGLRSLSVGEVSFVVDRPFYFAVHHKAVPTALMAGYVADPSS